MSIAAGIHGQVSVLHALILRSTRSRFGGRQLGYAWALVEPSLWVLTFELMFVFGGKQAPRGMAPIAFLATGIVTFLMFRKVQDQVSSTVKGNKSLLVFPHVTPLDFMVAAAVLESTTLSVVFMVLVGGGALASGTWTPVDTPLYVLGGLSLAAALGYAFGLVMHGAVAFAPTLGTIRKAFMRPLFWTSGLFFTAADLPSEIRSPLLYNPVLHTIELVRAGWFPQYPATYADPLYVVKWIMGLAFVGLMLERMARARL